MSASPTRARLAENLARVDERIAAACRRTGRDRSAVKLVAVTKYADAEWIRELYELGVRDFGESRPQQLEERAMHLPAGVCWHLIGRLQKNKVRRALAASTWIHSIDSLPLLERVDRIAGELQLSPRVLFEVNVSGEASKSGFAPDDLFSQFADAGDVSHVEIAGLMTMAPAAEDPESARPHFRALRLLRERLAATTPSGSTLTELSMGMSGDFEAAVEEGATMVRVGSSLFEGLTPAMNADE